MIENFTVFGRTFSAYMICALIGIFAAGIYAICLAVKSGVKDTDFLVLLLWSSVGVFIGGHLLYAITNLRYVLLLFANLDNIISKGMLFTYLQYIFGGSVFYGGLIGGLIVGYLYANKKKFPIALCCDIAASAIPLFHFFGRIGCFLSGCCFGVEWSHGITYTHSVVEISNGVPRLPVQLIEAFFNLVLFAVFYYLFKNKKFKGNLIALYFISYGIIRFTLEFFRGDFYRGFLFGLSTSQIISIMLIIFAFIILFVKRFQRKDTIL